MLSDLPPEAELFLPTLRQFNFAIGQLVFSQNIRLRRRRRVDGRMTPAEMGGLFHNVARRFHNTARSSHELAQQILVWFHLNLFFSRICRQRNYNSVSQSPSGDHFVISRLFLIHQFRFDVPEIFAAVNLEPSCPGNEVKTFLSLEHQIKSSTPSQDLTMQRTLLTFAAVLTCLVQTNIGWAQSGTFSGTVDDIPVAPGGETAAYYVPATGDVILSVGPGQSGLDVMGRRDFVDDDFIVENFDDSTALGAPLNPGPDSIPFLSLVGSLPSGVFNIGPILPADSTITDGGTFDDVFGGSLKVGGGSFFLPLEFPFQVVAGSDMLPVVGDFNNDFVVDISDLDQYIGNLNQPATGELASLDLNSDGQVTTDDFEIHYSQLVETSNGQTGTFTGDANLDGTVGMSDAMALITNLFSETTSWATGNFNADGRIDVVVDAFALVRNFGNSN